MSSETNNDDRIPSHVALEKQVKVQPDKRPVSGFLFGISLAVLGGFLGGVITNYGPTYLHVHLTEAVLEPTPVAISAPGTIAETSQPEVEPNPVEATPDTALSPTLPMGANARLVAHANPGHYLILQTDADPKWARPNTAIAHTASSQDSFLQTYTQPARTNAVPSQLRDWKSSSVSLYDAKGYVCSAKVGKLVLLQQVADDFPDKENKYWDNASNLVLAAKLSVTHGRCKNAIWARDSRLPAPAIASKTKANKALRKLARRSFRASSEHRKIQQEYKTEGHQGKWDQSDFDSIQINVVSGPSEVLLHISASVGGCGEFTGRLDQLYRVSKNNTLTRIGNAEAGMDSILSAVDFDGDGDLDFVTDGDGWDHALVIQDMKTHEVSRNPVEVYMCRC